jgi:Heavy metal binding domain
MNKNKIDQGDQDSSSMLSQKTNEDYNKQKPNPNDPNLTESNRIPKGWGMHWLDRNISGNNRTDTKPEGAMKTYTCPMHHEVKSDKPGKCPTCGMVLIERK